MRLDWKTATRFCRQNGNRALGHIRARFTAPQVAAPPDFIFWPDPRQATFQPILRRKTP
jgi:hypothetical protein